MKADLCLTYGDEEKVVTRDAYLNDSQFEKLLLDLFNVEEGFALKGFINQKGEFFESSNIKSQFAESGPLEMVLNPLSCESEGKDDDSADNSGFNNSQIHRSKGSGHGTSKKSQLGMQQLSSSESNRQFDLFNYCAPLKNIDVFYKNAGNKPKNGSIILLYNKSPTDYTLNFEQTKYSQYIDFFKIYIEDNVLQAHGFYVPCPLQAIYQENKKVVEIPFIEDNNLQKYVMDRVITQVLQKSGNSTNISTLQEQTNQKGQESQKGKLQADYNEPQEYPQGFCLTAQTRDKTTKVLDTAYRKKLITSEEYLRGKAFQMKPELIGAYDDLGNSCLSSSEIIKVIFKSIEINSKQVSIDRQYELSLWKPSDYFNVLGLMVNLNKMPSSRVSLITEALQRDDSEQQSFILGFLLNRYSLSDYSNITKKRFANISSKHGTTKDAYSGQNAYRGMSGAGRGNQNVNNNKTSSKQNGGNIPIKTNGGVVGGGANYAGLYGGTTLQRPEHRPKSPVPRSHNLKIWLNSKGKEYYKDNDLTILLGLLNEANEHLLSSYDVFLSDKDEEEFVDTLSRIVKRKKRSDQRGRSGNNQIRVINTYTVERDEAQAKANTVQVTSEKMRRHQQKTNISIKTENNLAKEKGNEDNLVGNSPSQVESPNPRRIGANTEQNGQSSDIYSDKDKNNGFEVLVVESVVDSASINQQLSKNSDETSNSKGNWSCPLACGNLTTIAQTDSQRRANSVEKTNSSKIVNTLGLSTHFSELQYPEIDDAKDINDIFTKEDLDNMETIISGCIGWFLKKKEWHEEFPKKFKITYNDLRYGHKDKAAFCKDMSDICRSFMTNYLGNDFTFVEIQKILQGRTDTYSHTFNQYREDGDIKKLTKDLRDLLNTEINDSGKLQDELNHKTSSNLLEVSNGVKKGPNIVGSPVQKAAGLRGRKGGKYARLVTPTLGSQKRESNILKLKCLASTLRNEQKDMNEDNKSVCTTRSRINDDFKLREELISKFFDKMKDTVKKNIKTLEKIIERFKKEGHPLSDRQIENLNMHMEMEYYLLQDVLSKYSVYEDYERIKDELLSCANLSTDNVSSMSPTVGIRTKQYYAFRRTLNTLMDDYRISDKQFNMFIELFAHEDFNILAAYEVFNQTNDMEDFIDTLWVIEMFETQMNRLTIVDDFEDVKDIKEKQFNLIYKYKNKIPSKVFRVMGTCIQRGDKTILEQGKMYKDGKLTEELLIKNQKHYGETRQKALNEREKVQKEQILDAQKNPEKVENEANKQDLAFAIEEFGERFKTNNTEFGKLIEVADKEMLDSFYEVFKQNADKGDFFETLKQYLYHMAGKKNPSVGVVIKCLARNKYTFTNIGRVFDALLNKKNRSHRAITDMVEIYEVTEDEGDFLDTLKAFKF